MTYYKILDKNGRACHGGTGQWHLPTRKGRPGKWMPAIADPYCCVRGYHVVKASALIKWLDADDRRVWIAEIRGQQNSDGDGKTAAAEARLITRLAWDAQIARAFACDCAERVLPIFEKHRPGDSRPRRAIDIARAYVRGTATREDLAAAWDAAGAAAWNAEWATAGTAAWDAAGAAAWAAAGTAARDAAGAAAWAAAWTVAGAAARAAEQKWQTKRLLKYLNGECKPC